MSGTLERLLQGQDLPASEAGDLLRSLADPTVDPAVKGALLAALRAKGETAEELRGMAVAMREMARPVAVDPVGGALIDTCGTGGDGSHTINVSTGASLVLAGCGLRVVKHGNRSVSSRSGSADVLEALGVALAPDPDAAMAQLGRTGWTFLFAPHFHPAMASVGPVRRAMKVRTAFNLLGPLTNPARPPHQLVGGFSERACELLAGALSGLPIRRCAVVHGALGWDEATPVGPFRRWTVTPGRVEVEVVDPEEAYGVPRCPPEALAGGDAATNADSLRAVAHGARGPHRDAILLNAAIALELVTDLRGRDALAAVADVVDSGAVATLVGSLAG